MKRSPLLFVLAVVALRPLAAAPLEDRAVVLMSLDGLAHFYLDDPQADLPTLRQLAAEGARAEKMQARTPTVTWPNHTTLVTGVQPARHGVVGNSYFDRAQGKVVDLIWDPLLNKEELVKVPTVYDVAKQADLRTAAIAWPGSRGAKTLDWTLPCVNKNLLFYQYGTPALWPEFQAAGLEFDKEEEGFRAGHGQERDWRHVQMLKLILRTHRPQLSLLHILDVDHQEHLHGPQSPEAYQAVSFADACVREVWEELQRTFPGQATLVIVSDHGFRRYRQMVQPNVVLRQAGLLEANGGKIATAQVRCKSEGGSTFVYILDEAHRAELLERTLALFRGLEGIEKIILPADFAQYGLADPATDPHMGDFVLSAKSEYMFSDALTGDLAITPPMEERGAHGYDGSLPELHATFVACGAGIKAGVRLPTIQNTAVAPTVAALLGLKMPGTDGQPLETILTQTTKPLAQ